MIQAPVQSVTTTAFAQIFPPAAVVFLFVPTVQMDCLVQLLESHLDEAIFIQIHSLPLPHTVGASLWAKMESRYGKEQSRTQRLHSPISILIRRKLMRWVVSLRGSFGAPISPSVIRCLCSRTFYTTMRRNIDFGPTERPRKRQVPWEELKMQRNILIC